MVKVKPKSTIRRPLGPREAGGKLCALGGDGARGGLVEGGVEPMDAEHCHRNHNNADAKGNPKILPGRHRKDDEIDHPSRQDNRVAKHVGEPETAHCRKEARGLGGRGELVEDGESNVAGEAGPILL